MMQPELTGARRIIHEQTLETRRKITERRVELQQLEADKARLEQAAKALDEDEKPAKRKAEVIDIKDFSVRAERSVLLNSTVLLKKLPRRFTASDLAAIAPGWELKRVYNELAKWKSKALILPVSRGVYRKV